MDKNSHLGYYSTYSTTCHHEILLKSRVIAAVIDVVFMALEQLCGTAVTLAAHMDMYQLL